MTEILKLQNSAPDEVEEDAPSSKFSIVCCPD